MCQGWVASQPVQPSYRLTAADVGDAARVHGLVAFLFACFGAGTPDRSGFPHAIGPHTNCSAEPPFVAALPRRLLAHPNGPALAVIGHVDRAWAFSIRPRETGPQVGPFRNLLRRLLKGEPAGHATKELNEKFTLLSSRLLHLQGATPRPTDSVLARLWIDRNDFQNYVLLGDPAVRLRTESLL
jgi:hypothetical protein